MSTSKHGFEILNSDDHIKIIKSKKKSLEDYRPDVTHHVKLIIF